MFFSKGIQVSVIVHRNGKVLWGSLTLINASLNTLNTSSFAFTLRSSAPGIIPKLKQWKATSSKLFLDILLSMRKLRPELEISFPQKELGQQVYFSFRPLCDSWHLWEPERITRFMTFNINYPVINTIILLKVSSIWIVFVGSVFQQVMANKKFYQV